MTNRVVFFFSSDNLTRLFRWLKLPGAVFFPAESI